MRHHISKKERALLTLAAAQRAAGPGRTPSARQLRRAHDEAGCAVAKRGVVVNGGADATDGVIDKACGVLSGIGGETDAECGNFWSRLKSVASQAAPLAPLFGPTAVIAVPIAQKIAANRRGTPAPDSSDDQSVQEVTGIGFGPERQKIEDYTYIFGDELDEQLIYGEGAAEAAARRRLGGRHGPRLLAGDGLDEMWEIEGDGLDEMWEIEGGGAAEAAAQHRFGRRRHPHHLARARRLLAGYQPEPEGRGTMGGLPHDAYRVAIVARARKIAGGRQPTAKQMAQAQASVDKEMRARGLAVAIPGARPGRVTR